MRFLVLGMKCWFHGMDTITATTTTTTIAGIGRLHHPHQRHWPAECHPTQLGLCLPFLRPRLKVEGESFQFRTVHIPIAIPSPSFHDMLTHTMNAIGVAADYGRQAALVDFLKLC